MQNRNKMGALRQEVEMLRKQNQEYQVGSTLLAHLLLLITVTFLDIWSQLQATSSANHTMGIQRALSVSEECSSMTG